MKTQLIGENIANIHNILKNRGYADHRKLINLDETEIISPWLLKNMKEAVECIRYHIENDTGYILIQQDPDADGLMSSASLYNYLTICHPELEDRIAILIQDDKSHRINKENVYRWHEEIGSVGLVIAPDCSSNEEHNHKEITEKINCDIVVFDHHDMEEYSNYAIVVNPSKDDYPNKNMSGVMVCMKFFQAYDEKYDFDNSKFFYDMVAVGVIGDMIEINTPETIYTVQRGLTFNNLMLKAIEKQKSYSLASGMNAVAISFYIAPVINALTRVGTIDEKAFFISGLITNELFTVPSTKRGAKETDVEEYHDQIARIMNNIQSRQKREREKMTASLEKQIIDNNLEENQVLILDTKGDFPNTFNGLIANELRAIYGKPIFVGKEITIDKNTENERIVFGGSARGDENSEILPALKQYNKDSNLFDFAEGHEAAHGIQFPLDNKEAILSKFNDDFNGKDFAPVYKIDFDKKYSDVKLTDLEEITQYFSYWARGFEEPQFVLRDIPIDKDNLSIKGDFETSVVSFKLKDNVSFIGFKIPRKIAVDLAKGNTTKIDVIGNIRLNSYGGSTNLQVNMIEVEASEEEEYLF